MNTVGSVVAEATKLNHNFVPSVKITSQFDKLNSTLTRKGVGAMTESIRKMSVAPTFPGLNIKTAIQHGNSFNQCLGKN